MSNSVELKGVEETLMIPLWGRAIATQRGGLADLRREELGCLPLTSRLLLLVMRRMRWFRESSRLVRLSSLDE